ncbi:DUF6000 family protein [Bernardetia sp.]|uniref:DUF6000 family protein n=1 Tax=Bernardetia sp. TaxID=1937974 RepID=UPI0025C3FF30|nr:DUF6000 family protein [Bernardetia sp.]
MKNKENDFVKLHVAGATVRHSSLFDELKSFKNDFKLKQEFIDTWVIPFYRNIHRTDDKWTDELISTKNKITTDIIQMNLGDFNWRTRQTGAFFSAIANQTQFIDIIGTHLLKSEVCYAGRVYCKVLASFNLPKCINYLNLYLDYYLTKPDLWFDQQEAIEAVLYLDKVNSTNNFDMHVDKWTEFIKNKPYWEKEVKTDSLEKQLNVIQTVRQHTTNID